MKKMGILILFAATLTACDGAVTNFVSISQEDPAHSVLTATGPIPLKVSPGSVTSAGGTISMHATVTPTDQTFKASTISAQMSLHRQRVSPP